MSNYSRNKGRNPGRWVQLTHFLLETAAYKSLSPNARAALTEFKKRYNGKNNGYVHCSVRSLAQELGCSPNTASKGIKELEEKGFIKCRFKGKFDHKVHRASEFILTEYPFGENKATKDYVHWKPDD